MKEMKNSVLVTITGLAHYYGTKPFKVGAVIKLKKEYDNKYDDEAIRAQLPYIGTVGYVANSTYTVYSGSYRRCLKGKVVALFKRQQVCRHMK